MCNCGNKRDAVTSALSRPQNFTMPVQKGSMWPDEYFEYTGKTALTVTGNISGKKYRFNSGEKLLVDYRDASGLMKVPVLKRVTK